MIASAKSKLRKNRKRRSLIISAGGIQGGIQCIYLSVSGTWEVLSQSFMPYPQKVASLIERCADPDGSIHPAELAWLDYKLSLLFIESARTTLAQIPTALRKPHYVVLNKPSLWKGATGENLQQSTWDIPVGDAQYVASTLEAPVITDLVRHNILAGGPGTLPVNPGNQVIASRSSGTVLLLNIGVISRTTVIDTTDSSLLIDSDSGPGTCLLNKVMRDVQSAEGFDRDGSLAAQGNVDGDCLNHLAETAWFLKPAPKHATPDQFDELLRLSCVQELDSLDRIATITALPARSAYDFFRREYRPGVNPQVAYISGGALNNLTLMEYLSTYFDPIPVRSIEELGVPGDMRIPLAIGLTVDAFISGASIPWETGNNPKITPPGRWIFP